MERAQLTVREIEEQDIAPITRYWLDSDATYMQGMGVDLHKLPSQEQWYEMLSMQLRQPYAEKQSYCLIWEADGVAVGHSNINKISFQQEAFMHLHLWQTGNRQQGWGQKFVALSLPHFFQNLQLQRLFCEPYALNPGPNKTLKKLGFSLVKEYTTTPGWINFEQPVCQYELTKERFESLYVNKEEQGTPGAEER